MKLSSAFIIAVDLAATLYAALPKTLLCILHSPSLLLRPRSWSRIFMAYTWASFGDSIDKSLQHTKESLITPNAFGVVLDLGAGHGHTVNYLDRSKVTKYVALEPNVLMHPHIRETANKAGYSETQGTLHILSCGAEDVPAILLATAAVDTIVSILTLCTVPDPQRTIRALVRDVLRPRGGCLLFFEHTLSDHADVAWWQRCWAPLWALAYDGCRLDRPTHLWIEREGEGFWSERETRAIDNEPGEMLFTHRLGRYVKA